MRQLVLPFEDLVAAEMEWSLVPYSWDKGKDGGSTWMQQYMGDWARPAGFLFSTADVERILVMYDDLLYMTLNKEKPWLQLFLPFPIYSFAHFYKDEDGFESERALSDLLAEFNRMRKSLGMQPKFRFRPKPRTSLFTDY